MRTQTFVLALCVAGLSGCVLGPDYQRPDTPVPAAWKQPTASTAPIPDAWWHLFGDDELDRHVAATLAANQDLAGALARFDQSRALLGVARADEFPDVRFDPAYS